MMTMMSMMSMIFLVISWFLASNCDMIGMYEYCAIFPETCNIHDSRGLPVNWFFCIQFFI